MTYHVLRDSIRLNALGLCSLEDLSQLLHQNPKETTINIVRHGIEAVAYSLSIHPYLYIVPFVTSL